MPYLGNPLFFKNYLGNPNYIYSEDCYDAFGLSARQIKSDVCWLNGALLTTLTDADICKVNMGSGDGIVAFDNLKQSFANAGLGIQ